jgi:MYXO-CTERM domain-containing protein
MSADFASGVSVGAVVALLAVALLLRARRRR